VTPTPSFTVNSPSICIGGSVPLVVVPTTTATGASSYTWTPITNLSPITGSSVTATPTLTSSYTVTGINIANGISCTNTAVTNVTVNPLPIITISVNPVSDSICSGSTATLTAGGAVTYTWNSPSTTTLTPSPNILLDAPVVNTNYTVTGTSSFGCINTATANVIVNNPPTFSLTVLPSFSMCIGGIDTIEVISTYTNSVNPNPTYTWTSPTGGGLSANTGTFVTVTPTGTVGFGGLDYTVTATSGACTVTHHAHITIHNPPALNPTPISDTSVCSGQPVTLNAHPTSFGGGNTYTWTPIGINTVSVTINPTTTNSTSVNIYTVQATSGNGCISLPYTVTVNVNPIPTVSPSVNNPLCKGETIDLTANSLSGSPNYIWTGPGAYTSNVQNPTIPNATTANDGIYTLTIMENGCSNQATISVIVNNPPIISVTPSSTVVCPNIAHTYIASGASTYTWSPSTGLSATTGSMVSAASSTTTDYTVYGANASGCISFATFTLNIDSIRANFTPTPDAGNNPLNVVFTNSSLSGTATNTYSWNYGNGLNYVTTTLSDTSTNTTYTAAGTYTVILTAVNSIGCVSRDTAIIIVTESYSIIIPNIFTPNGDGLNDNYMVKSEGVTAMTLEIYDRWGLQMFDSSTINAPWDGKTKAGKEAPDGTYFYIIDATDKKGNDNKYKGFLTLIR
jgi:gliding motility-associated-like protein